MRYYCYHYFYQIIVVIASVITLVYSGAIFILRNHNCHVLMQSLLTLLNLIYYLSLLLLRL